MTFLVAHLAELTRHRNREQADVMLVETLVGLLRPQSLALHRCVGEPPDARWLTCVVRGTAGAPPLRRPVFELLPLLQHRPAWLECLQRRQCLRVPGTPVTMLFPLLINQQAAGVLELRAAQPLDGPTRRTVEAVLQLYGNFLGLLDYGERDTLTGLLNRKTFDDTLMRAVVERAEPAPSEVEVEVEDEDGTRVVAPLRHWLAVLDIDHFKQVNDRFGHLIGDEVLLLLAGIMRACFRFGDQLFRFGGEEFVVLLNTPDEKGAATALQRLRADVERFEFPQVGRVTLSIGFTQLRETDTPSDAVDRADRALYHAKSTGRNRVVGPAEMDAAGMAEAAARRGDVDLF